MESVEEAAKDTLAFKGAGSGGGKKPVAGWSEFVKPYADESKFWHSLWTSAGKPIAGDLVQAMKQSKNQYKYAIRRLKNASESIQNDKFVSSILKGGVNIFQEIKKHRGNGSSQSSRIDDEVGPTNIANHFAEIYSELYNRVDLGDELSVLSRQLNEEVGQHSITQVDRINEDLIKQALKLMKGNKADSLFEIQSDCMINGPPELVTHLTSLIKAFVIHGTVPYFVLLCTLLPLVKDNLGDITSSDNYRAIASGSLLLKLLDIVVLLLEGDKLNCDQLQFGFQPKSGTVMCSWTATAVINHFNSKGRPIYGCAMDLSKAFDMVDWRELFPILKRRQVDPIFLRVLMFVYKHQQCDVKCGQSYSYRFSVCNGVRQGAVSSPLLFSVYIDDLILSLRASGWGCYIATQFFGCLGYADDLLLLSASRTGLQSMVKLCEKFASKKNLMFSTDPDPSKSKTKCIVFAKKARDRQNISPVLLNGLPLPWVGQVKHLGNVLQSDNSMKVDLALKRGRFIGKVNSLLQEFHYVDPSVFIKIMTIFTTSFYGSGIWDLQSSECDRLFKSWKVSIRHALGVPNTTHRYLIESLSGCQHAKTMLSSRLVKFCDTMMSSTKSSVKLLAYLVKGDQRTVMGKNMASIERELGNANISSSLVKRKLKYFPVPVDEEWRIPYLRELLDVRSGKMSMSNIEGSDVTNMINQLCTN